MEPKQLNLDCMTEKRRKIKVGDEIEFFKLPKLQERFWLELKIYIEEILLKICLK